MSVYVSARVWPLPLVAPEKLLLLRLADAADDDGSNARPSVARMARETGLCERAVRKHLRGLRDRGLIRETAAADFGAKKPTVYRVDLRAIEAATPAQDAGVKTPAPDAPLHEVPPTPASGAGEPLHEVHPTRPYTRPIPVPDPETDPETPAADVAASMLDIYREELGAVLPLPRKLNDERRRSAKARLKNDLAGDLEQWRAVCRSVRGSTFLTGGGSREWKADFDWLLKPANLLKVQEGRYDRRGANGSAAGAANPKTILKEMFDGNG